MSNESQKIADPGNYEKLSVPFESIDAANEAVTNFFNEVREIRNKYKIPDVLIVTKGSIRFEDGPGEFMQHSSHGHSLNVLPMAAYAYGQAEQEQKEIIAKLLSGKRK